MSFLATRRAGLEMLLGLDDLRLFEDVHAARETLERLGDLLVHDDLGLLEDVRAARETLEAIVHLLGDWEHPCELAHPRHVRIHERLGDLLGLQGGKHRAQLGIGTHLGSWGTQRARGLVVTGAVAERADHVVRLWEVRVVRVC